jgi:hypothetical protein
VGGVGSGLSRLGDRLLVVAPGTFLAAALLVFGMSAGPLGGLGLDLRPGGLQPGQSLLPGAPMRSMNGARSVHPPARPAELTALAVTAPGFEAARTRRGV